MRVNMLYTSASSGYGEVLLSLCMVSQLKEMAHPVLLVMSFGLQKSIRRLQTAGQDKSALTSTGKNEKGLGQVSRSEAVLHLQ